MRKLWLLLAAAVLLTAFGLSPMETTDLSRLRLVQTMVISTRDGQVRVDCGENLVGQGEDLAAALSDLKAGAAEEAFFATAQHIILCDETLWAQLIEIPDLRPAAELYQAQTVPEAKDINDFLTQHASGVTLLDLKTARLYGETIMVPDIRSQEGGYRLVNGKPI